MERAGAERSLVIELMERPDVADAESAALHFDELASGNDALRSAAVSSQQLVSKPERLGCDPPCFCVCGTQTLVDGEGTECHLQVRTSTHPILSALDALHAFLTCAAPGAVACRPACRVQDRLACLDHPTGRQAHRDRRQADRHRGGDGGGRGTRTVHPRQYRDQRQGAIWVDGLQESALVFTFGTKEKRGAFLMVCAVSRTV